MNPFLNMNNPPLILSLLEMLIFHVSENGYSSREQSTWVNKPFSSNTVKVLGVNYFYSNCQ